MTGMVLDEEVLGEDALGEAAPREGEDAEDDGTGQVGAGSDGSETGPKSTASTAASAGELKCGAELASSWLACVVAEVWARAATAMNSRQQAAAR